MSLKTLHLTKSIQYKDSKSVLFEDLNIDFPEYGIVAILGKSGCGKTSLLHILAGIDKDYEGDICLDRKNIKNFKDYNKNNIAMVYQDYRLFDYLTVYENCVIYNKIKGISYTKKEVEKLLDTFELINFKNKKVNTLSGGQKQRVAIIRALLCKVPILLCDEPTGALSPEHKEHVYRILKRYSSNHLIIIVSHDQGIKKYLDYCIDFSNLKKTYHLTSSSYLRYPSIVHHGSFSYLKESIKMLSTQKNKILMIFLSQIFIIASLTLFLTGLNGLKKHYDNLEKTAINNNLLTVYKNNGDIFIQEDIDELGGSFNYLLDTGKIEGVDYFQAYPTDRKLKENEVIVNKKMNQLVSDIHYSINDQNYTFKIKEVVEDSFEDPVLYYSEKNLDENLKTQIIDVSTCQIFIDDYLKMDETIKSLEYQYGGYCLVLDQYQSYKQVLELGEFTGMVFVLIAILIVVVLMFFILLSMFFEFLNDYVVLLSNGLSFKRFAFLVGKQIMIICLFQALCSSLFCFLMIEGINMIDLSDFIFGISRLFVYKTYFYVFYDLYILYLISYMIIALIIFLIMIFELKKVDVVKILREGG